MNRLTGKTALVTGGGQGVGHCPGVVRRGRAGGRRRTHTGPLDQAQAIEQCVAQVLEAFGTIDILVNNAQIVPLDRLLEVSDEAFAQGMDSGPLATLRLMRACHPYLRGGGVVVNLASSAAVRWDACGYGAYAAAKEAIRCLSRAAACEWGPDGIRVNVIAPHALSPELEGWMQAHPQEAEAFLQGIPHCENDIGRTVAWLASDEAGYLTGATLPLDGGQAFWG
ncbi:SDR family oxidoreductase [Pseudomonas guariconensis]|uniref:SDR family NAD(P)-dependent oxidoreductase n=1 Tax=Pseudomonas guariconensis TaxID=1288410 RepID=UPI0023640A2A|nr:SDR family oxidoreductase [Pseudomonas guariconensis]MDD2090478.1 SDR family oxidoreductase [Pseudomonas guariconensis]